MQEDLQTQIAVQTLMTHRRTTAEEHNQILNKTKQVGDQQLVKRVYNHVKYLQKKHFDQGLDDIQDENDQSTSKCVHCVFGRQWTNKTLHMEYNRYGCHHRSL